MFIEMLATFTAGVGLAGLALGLRKLGRGRIGRWVIPAAAGIGIIAFSTWNEYSWYGRVTAVLPEQVTVLDAPADRVVWRPWTYVFPVTSRFMALDGTTLQTSATSPDLRRADLMLVQRWVPLQRVAMAFDCAGWQQAGLIGGAALAADGTLTGTRWTAAATDDAMQRAACADVRDGNG